MELLQLNNSISPKSEWALGTSMSMCERLTVPLLTTIMFQNASSWRLVFSTKSLAEQKLKSLVTSLNDLTQQTTQQDTLLAGSDAAAAGKIAEKT